MMLVLAAVLSLAPLEPEVGRPEDFDDIALGYRAFTDHIAKRRLELWHVDPDEPYPWDVLAIRTGAGWWFGSIVLMDDGERRVSETFLPGTLADGRAAIVLDVITTTRRRLLVCSLGTTPSCGELDVTDLAAIVRLRRGVLRVGDERTVLTS